MKYKKHFLSILEKIEIQKIEKEIINLKNMFLKQKHNNQQLELLVEYEKEYIKKTYNQLLSGMCIYQWKNYNNFISMLRVIIKDNRDMLKKNQEVIKERLNIWSKSQKKLQFWKNLNFINKTQILNIKRIEEQILNDNYIQLKFFKKG
ncbi:flagellar export protein FliJ [Buchnera aphidicola (Brachycaudus cardui)]|uniref:Flagellar FliJ protein n=1 Tax=Buchnera aphidicola (Brachycaudus cardui) TaxID=557993 RepID=A0A4D6Y0V1_9GAMM|nr:flagellar FliJ family protein [Buchnera aphidicola]QCI20234.1 flagellar export protein FliJ [Buchnera aphidicola (Brachycaudus cardui)]